MPESSTIREDTKTRLIKAAGEVFAQYGYRASTVRQICQRACTHIGSVNYHFRDKRGLYSAIFGQSFQQALSRYPSDLGLSGQATPEEKLHAFIYSLLLRVMGEGLPAWYGKLMTKEIAEPSGALDQIVEYSIRPLYASLAEIVRELTNEVKPADGQDSEWAFLTSLSIVGQCLHHYIARNLIETLRPRSFDPLNIERIADHITMFSLGGIRELVAKAHPRHAG